MITIYHNPRCSKSRQTLQLLEEKGETIEIVKYLETTPSKTELKNILELLDMTPIELVRKGEAIWKEEFKGKSFSDDELIEIMLENPKLIERPIVIKGTKAVIGRPPEKVLDIL
ncbi:arsenate reductase (glutaredoxin) [Cochleicola gelatinilyticus]|uniref:Arsenate reductase n=1 Tax=Cochleicola gelatinilyticus TaxID=1763537 RepID=A0A167HT67_9FLAO|nr:arsenate reductase (glutaredoxin) [Cochleicola gelatinilyticus]OAB78939.1 arsenate reductase [Cochleicola gelatinilyticus]